MSFSEKRAHRVDCRGRELGLLEAKEVSSSLGELDGAGISKHVHAVSDKDEWLAMLFIILCAKCGAESWLVSKKVNRARMRFHAFLHQDFARSTGITEFKT